MATGRGGTVAPAGTAAFYIGSITGTSLGTGTIASICTGTGAAASCKGVATLSVAGSALATGSNSIIAYFSGDGANDGPSTSSVVTVTVVLSPVGNLELAVDASTASTTVPQTDTLYVSGWAGDPVDGSPLSNVKVYVDGVLAGTPTMGVSRPDVVSYTGNSAYAASGYTFTTPATGLSPGTHAVTVIAIDSGGVSTTFGPVSFTVTYAAPVGGLSPVVDAKTLGSTVSQSDQLYLSGWAADPTDGSPLSNVVVKLDGSSIGTPTLGVSRPDVVTATGNSTYGNSGYTFYYSAASLSLGTHTVTVVATNSHGVSTTLGPQTFTVTAKPPVGALAAPLDATTFSTTISLAHTMYVYGWAADYQDNGPAQTVTVTIDNNVVGSATEGQSSPDVATQYNNPAWSNVGYNFTIPASTIGVGTHTMTTTATNSLGISTTLGPVTFTVQ